MECEGSYQETFFLLSYKMRNFLSTNLARRRAMVLEEILMEFVNYHIYKSGRPI